MDNKSIGVFVKVNELGEVTNIDSEIFIDDFSDWIKVDEGSGDKYAHAQSHYLKNNLFNPAYGTYNYKLENGIITQNVKKEV